MGTKSQNRMASIRHEQWHSLTAVEGMNITVIWLKSAVEKEVALKLKIQKRCFRNRQPKSERLASILV